MSAVQHVGEHRVSAVARGWCDELGLVSGAPLWSMSAVDAGDALVLLTLDALVLRVLQRATAVGTASDLGLTPAAWWANATRTTQAEAHRMAHLAAALERHEDVAAALVGGGLRIEQARVIVDGATRRRMGSAFLDYIESRPESAVPSAGGVPATVVVTMDLDTLRGGLTAASVDTGSRISAGEARRVACRAGIIPIVLGGASVVLDAGRRRRFHSETQRIVMGVRDGGCTAAGCDAPPAFCHAHHDEVPWSREGGTSVEKGRLLCPKHHRLIHDPAFQHSLDQHGQVLFSRRT